MANVKKDIEGMLQESQATWSSEVLLTTRPISETCTTVEIQPAHKSQEERLANRNSLDILYSGVAAIGFAVIFVGAYFLYCRRKKRLGRIK